MRISAFMSPFLGFALLAGLSASAGAQTLSEAWEYALSAHPRIETARAQLRAEREALPAALAAYQTRITAQGSYSSSSRQADLAGGQSIDDDADPRSAAIEASRVVYSGGRREADVAIARTQIRLAEVQYEIARRDLVLEIAGLYIDFLEAEDRFALRNEAVGYSRTLAESVRARQARGDATTTEVALVDAELALAESELANAAAQRASLRIQFEQAVGFPPESPAWDFEHTLPEDPEEVADRAQLVSLDLESARLQTRQARLGLIAARRSSGPTASLSATHSTSRDVSPAVIEDNETRVSLNFTLPLSTGGRAQSDQRRAIANRSAARSAEREVEESVISQARQAWIAVQTQRFQVSASTRRRDAANSAREGVLAGYRAGVWSLNDVLDANLRLVEAEIASAAAQAELRRAEMRLAAQILSLDELIQH